MMSLLLFADLLKAAFPIHVKLLGSKGIFRFIQKQGAFFCSTLDITLKNVIIAQSSLQSTSPWKDCSLFNDPLHILKKPLSALLISRYILRLGQAAQKQQRPCCSNRKMYFEIRRADEWLLNLSSKMSESKIKASAFQSIS